MQIKILQHREKGSKCSILGPADALSVPIQLFSTELSLNYLTALRFFFWLMVASWYPIFFGATLCICDLQRPRIAGLPFEYVKITFNSIWRYVRRL